MQSRALELLVGFFVCLGIAAIFILTMRVSNLTGVGNVEGYTVKAAFINVGGLKEGAPVNMGGVRIGRVARITLDQQTYEAVARLRIDGEYKLPDDSDASILTSGLLGEQYVGVRPGGANEYMQDGDRFILTQSAVILEQLIGQMLYSMTAGDTGSSSSPNGGGGGGGLGDLDQPLTPGGEGANQN